MAYSLHLMLFGLIQQKLQQQGVVVAEFTGGLLLLATVFALGQLGAAPFWFVVALASGYIVTLAVTLVAARRLAPISLRLEPEIWRHLLVAALPAAATGIISVLYFRADVVILTFLEPPASVGLYGVASKVLDALIGFTLLLSGLFAPLFGRTARLVPGEFARHFEHALTTLALGAVGVAVVLFGLAGEIAVFLGGEAFRPAGASLALLGVVFVLHSSLIIAREAAIALHVQIKLLPGYLVGLVVALTAYFTLIPRLGAPGAALALIITELVILPIALRAVTRAAGHAISLDLPLRAVAAGITAAGLVFVLERAEFGWPVRVIAGGASYLALLLLTRALNLPMAMAIGRDILAKKRAS